MLSTNYPRRLAAFLPPLPPPGGALPPQRASACCRNRLPKSYIAWFSLLCASFSPSITHFKVQRERGKRKMGQQNTRRHSTVPKSKIFSLSGKHRHDHLHGHAHKGTGSPCQAGDEQVLLPRGVGRKFIQIMISNRSISKVYSINSKIISLPQYTHLFM